MANWDSIQGREIIYNSLKDHIEDIENVNLPEMFANCKDPMAQIHNIVNNLHSKNNNLKHIKQLCEVQEQKVFHKLREIKEYDLYDEMSKLNSELDFKNLSGNQLTNKWKVLQQKMVEQQETKILEEQNTYDSYQNSTDDRYSDLDLMEDENMSTYSEGEINNNFFKKMQDFTKFSNQKQHKKPSFSKKFLDQNNIHNLLFDDMNNINHSQNNQRDTQWGNILREIDHEDFNCQYFGDI